MTRPVRVPIPTPRRAHLGAALLVALSCSQTQSSARDTARPTAPPPSASSSAEPRAVQAPAPTPGAPDAGAPFEAPAAAPSTATSTRDDFTSVDFARHASELERRLPAGFTVVVEAPFVVIGDEAPEIVRSRAVRTVRWAVTRLKRDFFDHDPSQILDIWLFKDAASYGQHLRQLFGETPSTPYGFYSREHGVLVMNIATGGGTLVHEIVHPFMESNFPECPAWFNEGLGSLFEQSADRGGHIVGLTNWRLAGLQQAIRSGSLPSFRQLTRTTDHEFYEQDPGTNYAQSRYLLYYLQEQGLLVRFMREFLARRRVDPTGYATLQQVLGVSDMVAFQRRWEAYVLGLHFP